MHTVIYGVYIRFWPTLCMELRWVGIHEGEAPKQCTKAMHQNQYFDQSNALKQLESLIHKDKETGGRNCCAGMDTTVNLRKFVCIFTLSAQVPLSIHILFSYCLHLNDCPYKYLFLIHLRGHIMRANQHGAVRLFTLWH